MSEETQVVDNQPAGNTPEPNPVEQQAREMGWRPQDEYDGDPAKWVSAETFVSRAPLFEKIDTLSRQIKARDKDIEVLKSHYKNVAEAEYKRALATLRAEKRAKLEEGDFAAADELDEKIDELKDSAKQAPPPQPQPAEQHPVFVEWTKTNSWYTTDEEMRDTADAIGVKYAKRNLPPDEVLRRVTEDVKKLYPDKFRNPNKDRASAVETKAGVTKPAKANDDFDLTPDENKVMNQLIKLGVVTKEQYIADLKKVRG